MSEYFRRVIIKYFLKKELRGARPATSLITEALRLLGEPFDPRSGPLDQRP